MTDRFYFRFGFTLIKKNRQQKYSDPIINYVDSVHDGVQFVSYERRPEAQLNPGIEYC